MVRAAMFAVLGYLSGSVLYARVFARLFRKENMLEQSRDQNPGTANAFLYGGFWCGTLTLVFDLLKGFLPVYLFLQYGNPGRVHPFLVALVLAAPVIGHIFPLFYGLKGGKGIAVTFGCLAGLYPVLQPLLVCVLFSFLFPDSKNITAFLSDGFFLCAVAGDPDQENEKSGRYLWLPCDHSSCPCETACQQGRERPTGGETVWML